MKTMCPVCAGVHFVWGAPCSLCNLNGQYPSTREQLERRIEALMFTIDQYIGTKIMEDRLETSCGSAKEREDIGKKLLAILDAAKALS